MVDQARARRLAKRIGSIVASAIETEIKDPRLQFVTVTDVRVTGDLHDATIYYTVRGRTLSEEPDLEGVQDAFIRARGSLRSLVGAGTGVRYTPTLAFEYDSVPEVAQQLEEALARARAADAATARIREGATPAGEADPYKDPAFENNDSEGR